MRLTLLSAEDLRAALPMPTAIAAMRAAFAELSTGQAQMPLRTALNIPAADGHTLFMPAYLPSSGLGVKLVSVFPHNAEHHTPVLTALMVILDSLSGEPVALCDGTFLTAWRTGAATGLATDLLARPEAKVAALLGCGAQARTQALGLDIVRELNTLRVYAPNKHHVQNFIVEMQPQLRARLTAVESAADAVRGAEIVCTATTSPTPVFDGRLLRPGTHVNGIGSYTPKTREIDEFVVRHARIFVDSRAAALAEAGDLLMPLQAGYTRPEEWAELGEVLSGRHWGRRNAEEITFFKSVGVAVQDVAAASRALIEARHLGLGRQVDF